MKTITPPSHLPGQSTKRVATHPTIVVRLRPTTSDKKEAVTPRASEVEICSPSHAPSCDGAMTRGLQTPHGPQVSVPTPPQVPARPATAGDAAKIALRAMMGSTSVENHRLVLTTSSRAMEKPLAEVAATHPSAIRAAQTTLLRAKQFVDFATANCLPAAKIFGSFTDEKERTGNRFNQTGDIDSNKVDEAIEHGNLREHMCMLGNSQSTISRAMYDVGARAERDPEYAVAVQRATGADVLAIVVRYRATKAAGRPPEQFLHALEGTESEKQPHMRASAFGPRKAGRFSDFPFTPPLSDREKAHLNAWRTEQEAKGVAVPTRKDAHGYESFLLPQEDGKTLYRPKSDHTWHKRSNDERMSTRVSISGTAYRLMHMNKLLGANLEHSAHFRLALLGHVTPYHHTYHEVMSASVEMGMQYTPGVEGMRTHAQMIIGSHAGEPDTEPRRALLKTLNSVRRYESIEE